MGVVSLLKQRMNKKDCTRSRILLLISLSISDSLTCVVVLLKPYLNYTLIDSHLAHECTNNLMEILLSSCHIVTLLNLLGMAIDHWITFTKPFRYFVVSSTQNQDKKLLHKLYIQIQATHCNIFVMFTYISSTLRLCLLLASLAL